MSDNIDHDKVSEIIWELAISLASGAIGEVPGGFIFSSVFETVMGQFDSELETLRAELEEKIDTKIEDYASDRLTDTLTGFSDRLATYKTDGQKTADLNSLNLALEQEEAGFLGKAHAETLRWLPLTLGFQLIRVTVWDEIERNSELQESVNVKKQVQDFAIRAMPLVVRLILRATKDRTQNIEIFEGTSGVNPVVFKIDVMDGETSIYHAEASFMDRDRLDAARDEAGKVYHRHVKQEWKNAFDDLSKTYYMPLQNIANAFDVHIATLTSNPRLGPGFSLSQQYGDAKDIVVPNGAFVTGMSLYKHHNNVGIELRHQVLSQDGELDGRTTTLKLEDHGKTTSTVLNNQHADIKMVMCPPGKAVVGACFYKHHNQLAIELLCRSLTRESPQEDVDRIRMETLGACTSPLGNKFASTIDVDAPDGQLVIGARLYQHGNQVHIEIVSAPTAAVLEGMDFSNKHF